MGKLSYHVQTGKVFISSSTGPVDFFTKKKQKQTKQTTKNPIVPQGNIQGFVVWYQNEWAESQGRCFQVNSASVWIPVAGNGEMQHSKNLHLILSPCV